MSRLITVQKAKEEIKRLQVYVKLVEGYSEDTVEQKIIKEYAQTNSIVKVVEILNRQGVNVEREVVVEVIKRRPKDELHRIVRKGYMLRTKHSRKSDDWNGLYVQQKH